MFCQKCGNVLADGSNFCPNCGTVQSAQSGPTPNPTPNMGTPYGQQPYGQQPYGQQSVAPAKYNGVAIAGFVVSLCSLLINLAGIVGLVGLILSGVGYQQVQERNQNGKGMAITGIVIGIISVVWGFLSIIACGSIGLWY